jgi:hypothetical protein
MLCAARPPPSQFSCPLPVDYIVSLDTPVQDNAVCLSFLRLYKSITLDLFAKW